MLAFMLAAAVVAGVCSKNPAGRTHALTLKYHSVPLAVMDLPNEVWFSLYHALLALDRERDGGIEVLRHH